MTQPIIVPAISFLYETDAFVVTPAGRVQLPGTVETTGINARQVAGKEFLDAWLRYGEGKAVFAFVRNQRNADAIQKYWERFARASEPKCRLNVVSVESGTHRFFEKPPAPIFHIPHVIEPSFAWARRNGRPHGFALSGVTHGLAGARMMQLISELVTAPLEPYDALVCTSRASVGVIRNVTSTYADYLAERFQGKVSFNPRIEMIPLGVDHGRFHPPVPNEKHAARKLLGVQPDETAVLSVGRLAFHAKAHPFPIFDGLQEAARRTGKRVNLIFFGTSPSEAVQRAFEDGAKRFCGGVRVTFVDGTRDEFAAAVWKAADIYASLPDNTQETFGLSIVEAMASGLPVVASDWDGCRDTVVHNETGYLIPSRMIEGATAHVTTRNSLAITNEGYFLAECNQAVQIDCAAAADAFTRLIEDPALRAEFGMSGRDWAIANFNWAKIIPVYENLWAEQDIERRKCAAREGQSLHPKAGPAWFPDPETAFASYPSETLTAETHLTAAAGAVERVKIFLESSLTNYAPQCRCTDLEKLRAVLNEFAEERSIAEWDAAFGKQGIDSPTSRATIAWLLKYGLLV